MAILSDEGKDQQIEGTFDSAAVAVDLLLVPVVFVYIEHFAAAVLDYMVVAVDKYKELVAENLSPYVAEKCRL